MLQSPESLVMITTIIVVIESLGHLLALNPGINYVLDFLTVLEKKAASQYLECKVCMGSRLDT